MSSNYYYTKRNDSITLSCASLTITSIILLSISASYLSLTNSYSDIWENAELYEVGIKQTTSTKSCTKHTDSSGREYQSCTRNSKYNIQEHFQKINQINDTYSIYVQKYCIVNRLTEYYTYEAAHNQLSATKLYTRRRIYYYAQTKYDGICYDDKNIQYYQAVGYTIISFFSITFGVLVSLIGYVIILDYKEKFYQRNPHVNQENSNTYFNQLSDEELSNKTNLSCLCMGRHWNIFWYMADTDSNGKISICEFGTAIISAIVSLLYTFALLIFNLIQQIREKICNIFNRCRTN